MPRLPSQAPIIADAAACAENCLGIPGGGDGADQRCFRGRRVGLLSLVLVQVFPQFLGFIALFLLGQQIGDVADFVCLNTHGYLILVYLGGAVGFNAFLIKGYMDTVPGSLDESAAVEGASLLRWGCSSS